MKPGDLFITLPDHKQVDSDHFKPNEILVFQYKDEIFDERKVYYFIAKDRIKDNRPNCLRLQYFIPYVDPNYIPPKARSRFELIDI